MWVKRASDLTDEEKQRFIVADNVGFGDWDFDLLIDWDKQLLQDWGLELPMDYSPENKEKEIDQLNTEHKCPSCGYKW
jgi:hypothetical protein